MRLYSGKRGLRAIGLAVLLWGFAVGAEKAGFSAVSQDSLAPGFYRTPSSVEAMDVGTRFSLGPGGSCRVTARYGDARGEVMVFQARFDSPLGFREGLALMPFPPLARPPFERGDAVEGRYSFTLFVVKMLSRDGWRSWSTESVTACKPGKFPTVACLRAYRPLAGTSLSLSLPPEGEGASLKKPLSPARPEKPAPSRS